MIEVVPDLDQERVYHSDLKKLCTWYNELNKLNVLPFVSEEDAIEVDAEDATTDEAPAEGEAKEVAVEEVSEDKAASEE